MKQQYWKNIINIYILIINIFLSDYIHISILRESRKKKKEHRRGRFFPLSFNFTHRGAASMLKCYTTIDSLISLSPSFLPLRWRTKKKRNESGSNETRWIKRKMPESLYYQCSVSSRNRFFLDARVYQRDFVAYTPPCQSCDRTVNRGTMRKRVNVD